MKKLILLLIILTLNFSVFSQKDTVTINCEWILDCGGCNGPDVYLKKFLSTNINFNGVLQMLYRHDSSSAIQIEHFYTLSEGEILERTKNYLAYHTERIPDKIIDLVKSKTRIEFYYINHFYTTIKHALYRIDTLIYNDSIVQSSLKIHKTYGLDSLLNVTYFEEKNYKDAKLHGQLIKQRIDKKNPYYAKVIYKEGLLIDVESDLELFFFDVNGKRLSKEKFLSKVRKNRCVKKEKTYNDEELESDILLDDDSNKFQNFKRKTRNFFKTTFGRKCYFVNEIAIDNPHEEEGVTLNRTIAYLFLNCKIDSATCCETCCYCRFPKEKRIIKNFVKSLNKAAKFKK